MIKKKHTYHLWKYFDFIAWAHLTLFQNKNSSGLATTGATTGGLHIIDVPKTVKVKS